MTAVSRERGPREEMIRFEPIREAAEWRRPHLVMNPADDLAFHAAATSALQMGMAAEDLEAVLRPRYPLIVVHPRLLVGEPWIVWYVYRDGRWVPTAGKDRR